MKNNKPHFLLVHGAWHGGWVWKEMSDLLRYQGYSVSVQLRLAWEKENI